MRRALAIGVLALAACDGSNVVIDAFPVKLDFSSGVPATTACTRGLLSCDVPLPTIIDTGSALTMVDRSLLGDQAASRINTQVDLNAAGAQAVPRARWYTLNTLITPLEQVGVEGCPTCAAPTEPELILGGDALSQVSMRLDPQHQTALFFPNIAGTADVLADSCLAVLPTPPRGGGTLLIQGVPTALSGTRLVVGACLNPDQPVPPKRPTGGGADALLVVATGLPISVIGASTYERLRLTTSPPGTPLAELPLATLHPPGGEPIEVHLATLSSIGLAADEATGRGPCDELLASRIMALGGCATGSSSERCFCEDTDRNPCRAGASAEHLGSLPVAVVAEDSPLLQSLRLELRPTVAEVDGFLGMNAIADLVTDFDYPGARLILRCTSPQDPNCITRPRLTTLPLSPALTTCLVNEGVVVDPNPN